jgi:hypothetical protein
MDVELQKRNILIILGAFLGASILIAIFKTWKWFSRTGRIIIDLPVRCSHPSPHPHLLIK